MYIRKTQTRNTMTGERYCTHRLVKSERIGGKVKQATLLNLGRHFTIEQAHWPLLCARVEELLGGQAALVPVDCPRAVEREAQHIVTQLLVRQTPRETDDEGKPPADVQAVDVDSLDMLNPRTVGVEALGLWAMEQIDLPELFQSLGLSGPLRSAALASIIGRMAAPASDHATYTWMTKRSALGELLDVDFSAMPLMTLYRASDVLLKHRDSIERQVFSRASELFGLSTTVTLYDLTNTYMEGEAESNPKAKHGRSKEKRTDCPLVTLALVLDSSGFVRESRSFAGNVSEGDTLEKMLKALNVPKGALVVMDAGIAKEENLTWLRDNGYRYLAVSREKSRQFDPEQAVSLENAGGDTVRLQKVVDEEAGETRLYCHSEGRERKELAIAKRFADKFEAELQKLHDGLSKPRCEKRVAKLWERIGRLKAKSHGMGQHYHIEIQADGSGKTALAITWKQHPVANTLLTDPGIYCLRSNILAWDEAVFWRTYIMLTDLEGVFRSLKSELGLRPIYHHTEDRVDGHLFITVLAYQFVQIIRKRLAEHGIHVRWQTLRDILNGQQRVTATFRRADGLTLHVRKTTRAEPEQLEIYQALNLNPAPGGVKKMVV